MKKETQAQVFPVNFVKFLRTPFSQNTSGRRVCNYRRTFYPMTGHSMVSNFVVNFIGGTFIILISLLERSHNSFLDNRRLKNTKIRNGLAILLKSKRYL